MIDAAPARRIIGRGAWRTPAGPRFCWSGTSVVARFSGSSIGVRLRDGGNYFQPVLDGVELPILAATADQDSYPLASGLRAGAHELLLHRRTEAFVGETQLLGLSLDPG